MPSFMEAARGAEIALLVLGTAVLVIGAAGLRRGRLRLAPGPAFPSWPGSGTDLLLFLCIAFVGAVLGPIAGGALLRHFAWSGPAIRFLDTAVAFEAGFFAGLAAYHFGIRRLRVNGPGEAHPVRAGLLTFLAAFPVVALLAILWQLILERVGIRVEEQTIAQLFQDLPTPVLKLGFALFACVVAPIGEELVFRAGIHRYLRGRLERWPALLLSGLVFGGAHWALDTQAGAASFLPLTAFGVALALAYEQTGRIAAPILAHALFNLNTLLCLTAGLGS